MFMVVDTYLIYYIIPLSDNEVWTVFQESERNLLLSRLRNENEFPLLNYLIVKFWKIDSLIRFQR